MGKRHNSALAYTESVTFTVHVFEDQHLIHLGALAGASTVAILQFIYISIFKVLVLS